MSDPSVIPPPPPPTSPVPPPKSTALTWFFLISGGIVLFLTLGCILAVTEGNPFGEMGGIAHSMRVADLDPRRPLSLAGLTPPKPLSKLGMVLGT